MVGRRLREHELYARTVQLKLRYTDFSTINSPHSLDHATQLDTEIFQQVRGFIGRIEGHAAIRCWECMSQDWNPVGRPMNLLAEIRRPLAQALTARRQNAGIGLAKTASLSHRNEGSLPRRVHENPAGLPGKTPGEE